MVSFQTFQLHRSAFHFPIKNLSIAIIFRGGIVSSGFCGTGLHIPCAVKGFAGTNNRWLRVLCPSVLLYAAGYIADIFDSFCSALAPLDMAGRSTILAAIIILTCQYKNLKS
jgi:hypothetical protein